MPFRASPLYHWATTCVYACLMVGFAAFVGVAQDKLYTRNVASEAWRCAVMLAAVVESQVDAVATTHGNEMSFRDAQRLVDRLTSGLPFEVFVGTSQDGGQAFGTALYADACDGTSSTSSVSPAHCVKSSTLLKTLPFTEGLAGKTGTVVGVANYADVPVVTAYVPIPRIQGVLVVDLPVDSSATGAALGSVVGVYAAAVGLMVLAAFVLAWASAERLAGAPSTAVIGNIAVRLACLVPLVATPAFLAITEVGNGAVGAVHLADTRQTMEGLAAVLNEVAAGSRDGLQLGAALTKLNDVQSNVFHQATGAAASLHVSGATSAEAAGLLSGVPVVLSSAAGALPIAKAFRTADGVAVAVESVGPARVRIAYATRLRDNAAVRGAAVVFVPVGFAIIGVLAAVGVRGAGDSYRSRFDQAPHFTVARARGSFSSIVAMVIASATVLVGVELQLVRLRDGAASGASLEAKALRAANSALNVEAWHLRLVAGAALGSTNIAGDLAASTASSTAPASLEAALSAAADMYDPLSGDRSELGTVVEGMRENATTLFIVESSEAQVLSGAAFTDEAYSAAANLLGLEAALGRYVWTLDAAVFAATTSTATAAARADAATLIAEGFGAAADTVADTADRIVSSRVEAVRQINAYRQSTASTVRDKNGLAISGTTAYDALVAVDERIADATALVRAAARTRRSVSSGHAESTLAYLMAEAGYIAVAVVGVVALATVLLEAGLSRKPLAVGTFGIVATMLALRAAESEAQNGITEWTGPHLLGTLVGASWPTSYEESRIFRTCEAAALIGALAGNVTLPAILAHECDELSQSLDTSPVALTTTSLNTRDLTTEATASSAVQDTDTAFAALNAVIASDCPANSSARAVYIVVSALAKLRRAAFGVTATKKAVDTLTTTQSTLDSLEGYLTGSLACNANISTSVALFVEAAKVEAANVMRLAEQPSWHTVGSTSSAGGTAAPSVLPGSAARLEELDRGRRTASTHQADGIAGIAVGLAWVLAAVAIAVHQGVRTVVLERDNKAEFELMPDDAAVHPAAADS